MKFQHLPTLCRVEVLHTASKTLTPKSISHICLSCHIHKHFNTNFFYKFHHIHTRPLRIQTFQKKYLLKKIFKVSPYVVNNNNNNNARKDVSICERIERTEYDTLKDLFFRTKCASYSLGRKKSKFKTFSMCNIMPL
jgi:hypothetical protein